MPPQNVAFLAILAGLLLVYCECIWLGRIYFGVAGALLILFGLAKLPGAYLLAGAAFCFAIEATFKTYRLAAAVGTLLLAYTSWKVLAVSPALASIGSLLLGLITTALLSMAKQASQNKRADL